MNSSYREFLIALVKQYYLKPPPISEKSKSLKPPKDWNALLYEARAQGASSIIYKIFDNYTALKNSLNVPAEVFEELKKDYYSTFSTNLLFLNAFKEFQEKLKELGVKCIPLKGLYLIASTYEDIGLRPMGDIDVLIPDKNVHEVSTLLKKSGYRQCLTGEYHFTKGENPRMDFDVHAEIPYMKKAETEKLWDSVSVKEFREFKALSLPSEHVLFYMISHAGLQHGRVNLIGLVDLAQFTTAEKDNIDWGLFINGVQKYNLILPANTILDAAYKIFGISIPVNVLDSLSHLADKKSFKKNLYSLLLLNPQKDIGHLLYFFIYKGINNKFRYLFNFILPNREFMYRRYGIKRNGTLCLWYFFRAGSLLVKAGHLGVKMTINMLD